MNGLLKAWDKGNPAGAVEVLRALGYPTIPREGQQGVLTLLDLIKSEAGL